MYGRNENRIEICGIIYQRAVYLTVTANKMCPFYQ